ncbi:hypothetical protein FBU31_007138, partial [Coemansia sp. 'formosensis']
MATRCMRRNSTPLGRTLAISTFIIPKLYFLYRVLPFTAEQTQRLSDSLRRIVWGRGKPYLNEHTISLPTTQGGLGFPSARAIHRAVLLKMAHTAIVNFQHYHDTLNPNIYHPPLTPTVKPKDWAIILLWSWAASISHPTAEISEATAPSTIIHAGHPKRMRILLNPFIQLQSPFRLPSSAWPVLWKSVFQNAASIKPATYIDICLPTVLGNPLSLPLLGTPILQPTRNHWKILLDANNELGALFPLYTLDVIPTLINTITRITRIPSHFLPDNVTEWTYLEKIRSRTLHNQLTNATQLVALLRSAHDWATAQLVTVPESRRGKPYHHDLTLRNKANTRHLPFDTLKFIGSTRTFIQSS